MINMNIAEQFVYTAGPYREFRGYVFANGHPVTVQDRGTLEALKGRKDFKRVVVEVKGPPPVPVPPPAPPQQQAQQKRSILGLRRR